MIVKVRCESHYWFDFLSGHQSVYSISSIDWQGVFRFWTPCFNNFVRGCKLVGHIYLMMITKTLQGECSIKAFGVELRHQRSNQFP